MSLEPPLGMAELAVAMDAEKCTLNACWDSAFEIQVKGKALELYIEAAKYYEKKPGYRVVWRNAQPLVVRDLMTPSHLKEKDDRYAGYAEMQSSINCSPSDTWGLSTDLAITMLPKLRTFLYVIPGTGCPGTLTPEKWMSICAKMVRACEYAIIDGSGGCLEAKRYKDMDKGFELLGKYFCALWW